MNKKQKNKKIVRQNKRNRMINRRYSSTVKSLRKQLNTKLRESLISTDFDAKEKIKLNIVQISRKLFSYLDKAVKKGVLHKNSASRRKSRVNILVRNL